MQPKEPIYLIDGSNYIFRAYYAIRNLSTAKGFPTNAIFGFTNMLWKFLKENQPTHVAVVFDSKEPSFRSELFPAYKANRSEPPDDLVPQFPYFRKVTETLSLPTFVMPGFEADDIIGTLAKRLAAEGHKVVIMTGDKDFMQLVNDHITIWDSMKEKLIDASAVKKRFGVKPEQVTDVMGLAGDAVDNVKGVPGVGDKTAMKLIAQWGSLEEVLQHSGDIKGKLGERLRAHADDARLAQKLCTIHTDVDVPKGVDALQIGPRKEEALRELFTEFEFTRLLAELAPKKSLQTTKYQLITDAAALQTLAEAIRRVGHCALDTETDSLNTRQARLVGLAVATGAGQAAYIPLAHAYAGVPDQLPLATVQDVLAPLFADPAIAKYFQHAKYDLPILARHGLPVKGLACDTMLADYLLDPGASHGLDALAERHLQHTMISFKEVMAQAQDGQDFRAVPLEAACDYAAEDVDATLQLAERFLPMLAEAGLDRLYETIEQPLVEVLLAMEGVGIKVDKTLLEKMHKEFATKLSALERAIYDAAGEAFKISSPKQLGVILFEKLQLPGKKKTKTGYSTSASVLESLAAQHPLPRLILDYRSIAKLQSTYVDALPKLIDAESGRIHTDFNQTIAATGRLSSSNPNLQNIPIRTDMGRRIREAFIAEEGCQFLAADYSQIELRILAHMSGDDRLCSAFAEDRDVHAETAASLFGVAVEQVDSKQRAIGKTVNFAVIYGQTPFGMPRVLKIDPAEAKEYIDNYFAYYPGVAEYRQRALTAARKSQRVETLFGRRRLVPELTSSSPTVQAEAERMAFNTIIQGTAADLIKLAMIAIHRELQQGESGAKMILQIHDELIFEVPTGQLGAMQELVRRQMEGVKPPQGTFRAPLKVDVSSGPNWASC